MSINCQFALVNAHYPLLRCSLLCGVEAADHSYTHSCTHVCRVHFAGVVERHLYPVHGSVIVRVKVNFPSKTSDGRIHSFRGAICLSINILSAVPNSFFFLFFFELLGHSAKCSAAHRFSSYPLSSSWQARRLV